MNMWPFKTEHQKEETPELWDGVSLLQQIDIALEEGVR